MNRRELIALLGGAAALRPLTGATQPTKMPVVGMLSTLSNRAAWLIPAFAQGLRETGHTEGQKVRVEYRWAEGQYERLPAFAADFVHRSVDVIVAGGGRARTREGRVGGLD